MLVLYAGMVALHVPIVALMTVFGLTIAAAIALLMVAEMRQAPPAAPRGTIDTP